MNIFILSPTTSKIREKIEKSIYMTTGANDYVVKDRGSRLHPIAITKEQEKKFSWIMARRDEIKRTEMRDTFERTINTVYDGNCLP